MKTIYATVIAFVLIFVAYISTSKAQDTIPQDITPTTDVSCLKTSNLSQCEKCTWTKEGLASCEVCHWK